MTNLSIIRIGLVLISTLIITELASAQERSLNLVLTDLHGKPVPNVRVGIVGQVPDVTDRTGSAHIHLNELQREPEVELYVASATDRWVLISPWDGRIRTQLIHRNFDKPIRVVVSERGARQMLKESPALVAMASKIIADAFLRTDDNDTSSNTSAKRRQKALQEVARAFGLNSKEVDKAIRTWGQQSKDAYERGLAALYSQDFARASELLKQSSNQKQTELGKLQTDLVNASVALGKSLYDQKRYLDSVEAFTRAQKLKPDDPKILDGLGVALIGAEKFEDAEVIYQQLLQVIDASSGTNNSSYAAALIHQAQIYLLRGKYSAAEPLFLRALSIQKSVFGADADEVARTLNNLGLIYRSLADEKKAENCFQQAVDIFERIREPNPAEMAISLNNLGSIYYARNDYTRAEELYKRALDLIEKTSAKHSDLTASLSNLAALYYAKGDYDKALVLLQRVVAISEEANSKESLARALNSLAHVYSKLGNSQKALETSQQALALYRSLGDHFGEALAVSQIGFIYYSLGDRQKALDYYIVALPLQRQIGDLMGSAATLNNIGIVYSSLGQLPRALDYYLQAILLYRAVADRRGEAQTLNNVGKVYAAQAKYDEAEASFKQSLEIIESLLGTGDSLNARTIANLADLYRERGKYIEAAKMYLRAIEILDSTGSGNKVEVAINLVSLGETYSSQRKYVEAKPFFERALAIFENVVGKDDARTLSVRARLTSETIITITEPATDSATVGKSGLVRGTINNLAKDQHLWVLVRRKDITGWWPQEEPIIEKQTGTWETTVVFGTPEDLGSEFEIAAIVLNESDHLKLKEYFHRASLTGSWAPIKMPSTIQPPVFREAKQVRYN